MRIPPLVTLAATALGIVVVIANPITVPAPTTISSFRPLPLPSPTSTFTPVVSSGNAVASAAAKAVAAGVQARDYLFSCQGPKIFRPDADPSGMWLKASCWNPAIGDYMCTKINLATCVGNRLGQLVPQKDGHFQLSCAGCDPVMYEDHKMACNCDKGNGDVFYGSVINTNDLVSNYGGTLACFDQVGVSASCA